MLTPPRSRAPARLRCSLAFVSIADSLVRRARPDRGGSHRQGRPGPTGAAGSQGVTAVVAFRTAVATAVATAGSNTDGTM